MERRQSEKIAFQFHSVRLKGYSLPPWERTWNVSIPFGAVEGKKVHPPLLLKFKFQFHSVRLKVHSAGLTVRDLKTVSIPFGAVEGRLTKM